jgi:hypothetical protein
MKDLSLILQQRGSKYGEFEDNARISQSLKNSVKDSPNYELLSNAHKEALDNCFQKISRMCCGDPTYIDNIDDIINYFTLLKKIVENEKKTCDYMN